MQLIADVGGNRGLRPRRTAPAVWRRSVSPSR